jgi:NADH:ubiquinone oxidoreductase subunit 5 (subunit L)/multisubunit Na+/H+ antiporter MnhA subunit
MLLGAAAIAGLPPLNGFVGEWLIYRGLAAAALGAPSWAVIAAMGGIAALALVGGLATFCFVRLVGVALLGQARSEGACRAHEPGHGMVAPIVLLAAGCVALSLAAPGVLTLAAHVVRDLCAVPGAEVAVRSALAPLASFNLGLFALILVALPLFAYRIRVSEQDETWGCGYTAPSAAMQYSASSFAELLVSRAIPRWLRPRTQQHAPHGLFPDSAAWSAQHEDPLTRALYEPLLNRWGDRFSRLRWLQQGRLHFYLMYIAGIAVLALFWSAVRRWWVA